VAVTLSALAALITFDRLYGGRGYLMAGVAGLVLGMLVAWAAVWRGWLPLTATAVAVLAFAAVAGPVALRGTTIAAVVPTAATVAGLRDGMVDGWRSLLTALPPVPDSGPLLLVPMLCGLVAGLVGVLLCARTRLLVAPVLASALVLAAGLLLGTRQPVSLLAHGVGFAVLALLSAIGRRHRLNSVTAETIRRVGDTSTMLAGQSAAGRTLRGGVIIAVAAGLAWAAMLPPAAAGLADRYVLREQVQLPFDPSIYPSPLAGLRRYEVTQKEDVLFSVSGMPPGARLRLSVMDAYDGLVWTVAGAGAGRHASSGIFERVGTRLPVTETAGAPATVTVTIRELGGVWLPMTGTPTGIRFTGQRGAQLHDALRYNQVTGTGVLRQPQLLRTGDTIVMDTIAAAPLTPADVAGRPVEPMTQPDLAHVPEQVAVAAQDWTAGTSGPQDALEAIVKFMRSGAFNDGSIGAGRLSWPGHSAGRLREFLDAGQLVGDAEQYAATLGLIARALNLPTRVVLGVRPPGSGWARGSGATEVTGAMVTAWVEVNFAGAGWVAFDPTPPVANQPKPPQPQSTEQGTPQVIQPPLTPELPPNQVPPPGTGGPPPPGGGYCGWCAGVVTALIWAGIPLLTMAAVLAALTGLKTRRRRRRQHSGTPRQRIAGGWLELLDRIRDYGTPVPAGLTRREIVSHLYQLPGAELNDRHRSAVRGLAHAADRAVFGPDEPAEVGDFWRQVDAAIDTLHEGRRLRQRIAAVLNPVTLLPRALIPAYARRPR